MHVVCSRIPYTDIAPILLIKIACPSLPHPRPLSLPSCESGSTAAPLRLEQPPMSLAKNDCCLQTMLFFAVAPGRSQDMYPATSLFGVRLGVLCAGSVLGCWPLLGMLVWPWPSFVALPRFLGFPVAWPVWPPSGGVVACGCPCTILSTRF